MRLKETLYAVGIGCGLLGVLAAISGCSPSLKDVQFRAGASEAHLPIVTGSEPDHDQVKLSNGVSALVQRRGGIYYIEQEGTFTPEVFEKMMGATSKLSVEDRHAIINGEIDRVFGEIASVDAVETRRVPSVGYFKFRIPYRREVMSALKSLGLRGVIINPIVFNPTAVEEAKKYSPLADGMRLRTASRGDSKNYSGLERMRVPEFVGLAEADIGGSVKVDGSSVKLGITDTGITFNHPTFLNADKTANRIAYMRDFTREGRVYFNPLATFTAAIPVGAGVTDEDVTISAQVIVTPVLPAQPAGDDFVELKDLPIKVSAEIKARLQQPNAGGAKLGVLLEECFNNANSNELVDINGNGKTNDKLLVLYFPGATKAESRIYLDVSGNLDFRNSIALGDWNLTKNTLEAFAERIGFDFQSDVLSSKDGKTKINVDSISLVGYDAGNHGTHVAGIAAGSRTISNDKKDTLARGAAPAAQILLNRVCANNVGCNAMEAFIDLAVNGEVDLVNMSLGGLNPFNDGYGLEETMINRITALKNVLFVISAGNSGPGLQTVGSPSVARLSLSVGAAASVGMIQQQYQWPGMGGLQNENPDEDFMLFFSSRGPTAAGGFKPNVAAPGTELSSIQLNSAPGARGGLDVYWGTSMAAPAASGAYALFLDAVRKFNLAHPEKKLPSDTLTLRRVLIESARPFGLAQYTWADQGTGMIDLASAWKELAAVRDLTPPTALQADEPIELDYEVIVQQKSPTGVAYDGSRGIEKIGPAFGTGIYLNYFTDETLQPVYVSRKLSEKYSGAPNAGDLTRQLLTTRDEFVLQTTIYGSDKQWLKAGTLDQLNCWTSETANSSLIGRGVDIHVNPDGTGEINPFFASALNVCFNRDVIRNELPPGEHGALISAYRVVDGVVAPVASFVVPVFITVPHQLLKNSTAYHVEDRVKSFGVKHNYVFIPKGTSLVQVTLEVPEVKAGAGCSGVELMGLLGGNTVVPFKTRREARAYNCDTLGRPLSAQNFRRVVYIQTNPNPGMWDLNVFGMYKYLDSQYSIQVDYQNFGSSITTISGGLPALTGSFDWSLKEGSLGVLPDSEASQFKLTGLQNTVKATVAKGQYVVVENPLGALRKYPDGVSKVTITTGGSPGNDIDLTVFECDPGVALMSLASPTFKLNTLQCAALIASGGPTDVESVSFEPKANRVYAVRVDGYTIKDAGLFSSTETLELADELGTLTFAGDPSKMTVHYDFDAEDIAASDILKHPLFTSKAYQAVGSITLRTAVGIVLSAIPVTVGL